MMNDSSHLSQQWQSCVLTIALLLCPVQGAIASPAVQVAQQDMSAAQRAYVKGTELFKEGSADSLRKAIAQFEEALRLSQAANDEMGQSYSLLSLGNTNNILGNKQKALHFYNQALPFLRAVGDRATEAITLNFIGVIYSDLGNKQQALDFFNQALPIFRTVGDRSHEATILSNIGVIYSDLGNKQQALEFYNQALPIHRALGNRSGEATTLSNIGVIYSDLGNKQQALEFYNQALPIHRALGNRSGEATTLNNIGGIHSTLGNKQQALDFYNQALSIHRAVSGRSDEAITLNNIGLVYSGLGDKQQALDFYNQALSIYRAMGDRSSEATTFNYIASVYLDLGDNQKALHFCNQALPIIRAVGDRSGEAIILHNIGSIYAALGDKQKALDFYNQALPIRRAVGDRSGEAITINNIGRVYFALGDNQKALDSYNQALSIFHAVGDRTGEAITIGNLANLYRTQGNLAEALTQANSAITIIEDLRSKLANDALRTSYFSTVQGSYQLKIDILMQLHQAKPTQGYDVTAFETSDQSRARVLKELLTEAGANIYKDVSPDLLKREQTLNQILDAKEKELIRVSDNPATAKQAESLQQEIQSLLKQRQDLKNEIRRTSPAYAQLKYPKPITVAQLQQQLDDNTLILQYALGREKSYLWVLSKTQLTSYTLPKQADLEAAIAQFRTTLSDRPDPLDPNTQRTLTTTATQLTQLILAPAQTRLANHRLVIIPDGSLHTIPFAALAQPDRPTYTPLIEAHEIINLPSASTIDILRTTVSTRPLPPKAIALLADPVFGKDDDRLTHPTDASRQSLDLNEQRARDRAARELQLDRLFFTQQEADGILKLIANPNDKIVSTGFDASYDWVTNPQLSQYRYIHLATHGFFDAEKPELSSLILSPFDHQGHPRKAFLRLPDLFNLNLPSQLVTLSACQTGLGKTISGEGLMGMTRGLMYAGARRVTTSLWNVDDKATAELMQQFYQNLWQDRQSHVAALRNAQLHLWKQGSHPYYWSAFVMQGEWRD